MTLETQFFQNKEIKNTPFLDSFSLMRNTSYSLIKEIEDIYIETGCYKHNISVVLFGSPSRFEMLPYSDVDMIIFSDSDDNVSKSIVNNVKKKVKNLPYDKIDTPEITISLSDLENIALSNSPDGHMGDSLILENLVHNSIKLNLLKIKDLLSNTNLQFENLIFGYHFLSYRYLLKYNELGSNIKYSEGGSRDLLYLDWAADFISKNRISKESQKLMLPKIELGLPLVIDFICENINIKDAIFSINVINTIKHQVMDLYKRKILSNGIMSINNAKLLLNNFDYSHINNPNELINMYNSSRLIIKSIKYSLYFKFRNQLLQNSKDEDYFSKMLLIQDKIWRGNITSEQRNTFNKLLLDRGRWSDVTTIISQKDITSDLIDKIIDICIKNPGYLYTLRLAIQHPKISKLSLHRLLDSGLIAYDNDINEKYNKIIKNRLNEYR